MKEPTVINIQKYSVHDGDGIRTAMFFKGCLLNCWWCHNPESQRYAPELMFNWEKCSGCGYCRKACSHGTITIEEDGTTHTDTGRYVLCAGCLDYCLHNNREIVRKQYSIKELMTIANKDAHFYEESGGDVTLSRGEVMTQDIDYPEELCRQLRDKGYNVAIDAYGYAPKENYARLLPYVDTLLCDIKTLNDEAHGKYMGKSNDVILKNLEFLADHRADINIHIPAVIPVNSDADAMLGIITYLRKRIGIAKVNLLPYHNTGGSKYERLGHVYPVVDLGVPSQEHMEMLKSLFEEHGFQQVEIGG